MRQSGYVLTIKAFIPSPKSDFAKQAAAALAMDQITKTNKLPDNFAEIATITDIAGKYGSVEVEEVATEQTAETQKPSVDQDDSTRTTASDPETETKPKRTPKAE